MPAGTTARFHVCIFVGSSSEFPPPSHLIVFCFVCSVAIAPRTGKPPAYEYKHAYSYGSENCDWYDDLLFGVSKFLKVELVSQGLKG
jgi:hypothetical protein